MANIKQIQALTGVRGVAAYSVLIAHAVSASGVNSASLTAFAHFGMALFLILSGFVIHYNYGPDFADSGIRQAANRFLLARFARLYPLYFAGLILSVSFIPGTPFFQNAWIALSSASLTQSWFNLHGRYLIHPSAKSPRM